MFHEIEMLFSNIDISNTLSNGLRLFVQENYSIRLICMCATIGLLILQPLDTRESRKNQFSIERFGVC